MPELVKGSSPIDLTTITNDTKWIYTTSIGLSPAATSISQIVKDILTDTGTDIPLTLTTIDGKCDTISTAVVTTIPGRLDTIDSEVTALGTTALETEADASTRYTDIYTNSVQYLVATALSSPTAGSMGDLLQGIQASMGLASSGQTWFVAKTGSDLNAGTADSPFLTIQKAHDSASIADVIVIDSGTYDENVNVEGLKVTTSQLRFVAKAPFQVSIINSNVGATSTVYVDAWSVEFSNIYTSGDQVGAGGTPNGWVIYGGTQLNKFIDCAAILHSGRAWDIAGSVNLFINCFGYGNFNPYGAKSYDFWFAGGSCNMLTNCSALGLTGAPQGDGFYFDAGNQAILMGCRVIYKDIGFNVLFGTGDHLEDCKASDCNTNKVDTATRTMWLNFNESSKILAGNSEQDDFKAIWDDSKYLYTTALDGSEVADSIGNRVSSTLTDTSWLYRVALDGSEVANSIGNKVSEILTDTGTTIPTTLGTPTDTDISTDIVNVQTVVDALPVFGTASTGTLNDANPNDEITTASAGCRAFIGVSLENLGNGDDFDLQLQKWDGATWRNYVTFNITKAGGVISIDSGAGAVVQTLDEINFENVYLDSTRKLRLVLTKNSATDRNFPYFVNKEE